MEPGTAVPFWKFGAIGHVRFCEGEVRAQNGAHPLDSTSGGQRDYRLALPIDPRRFLGRMGSYLF